MSKTTHDSSTTHPPQTASTPYTYSENNTVIAMRWKPSKLRWMLQLALLALCTLPALPETVSSFPKPTDYVTDTAHVLTASEVSALDSLCHDLDHGPANVQVAVVVIRSTEGTPIEEWANDLDTKWKMGKKGSDRGLLLLLASEDHHYRIDVGYGLEGEITDGQAGDIGRAMIPFLHSSNYYGALDSALRSIGPLVTATQQPQQPATETATPESDNSALSQSEIAILLVAALSLSALILVLSWISTKRKKEAREKGRSEELEKMRQDVLRWKEEGVIPLSPTPKHHVSRASQTTPRSSRLSAHKDSEDRSRSTATALGIIAASEITSSSPSSSSSSSDFGGTSSSDSSFGGYDGGSFGGGGASGSW